MNEKGVYYRRNLPHHHPVNSTIFITFRLANSLPAHVLRQLVEERDRQRRALDPHLQEAEYRQAVYRLEKRAFGHLDAWLDLCTDGPRWLGEDRVSQIVAEHMHRLDNDRYRLLAYCIMVNHAHLLIDTSGFLKISPSNKAGKTATYPLADTLRLLKGRTAYYCNRALGRTGAFWHHESYDHVVRDAGELERIVWYILNNPVKAGLVDEWSEWRFTYLSPEFGFAT